MAIVFSKNCRFVQTLAARWCIVTCVRLLPLVVGALLVSLALVLLTIAAVAVVR